MQNFVKIGNLNTWLSLPILFTLSFILKAYIRFIKWHNYVTASIPVRHSGIWQSWSEINNLLHLILLFCTSPQLKIFHYDDFLKTWQLGFFLYTQEGKLKVEGKNGSQQQSMLLWYYLWLNPCTYHVGKKSNLMTLRWLLFKATH